MEEKKGKREEETKKPVSNLEPYYLTLAYNNGEMTFRQWLEQTKKWARSILDKNKPIV